MTAAVGEVLEKASDVSADLTGLSNAEQQVFGRKLDLVERADLATSAIPAAGGAVAGVKAGVKGAKLLVAGGRATKKIGTTGAKGLKNAGRGAAQATKNPGKTASKAQQAAQRAKQNAARARQQAAQRAKQRKIEAARRTKERARRLKNKQTRNQDLKKAAKAAGGVAARTPKRNPVISTGAVAVAGDDAGLDNPVIGQVATDARGVVKAFSPDNIEKTGKTTARAIPGILTGIAAPIAAAGDSGVRLASDRLAETTGGAVGKEYTAKEIASPVVDTAKAAVSESKKMLKPFVSGTEEQVTKTVRDDIGAAPIVLAPKTFRLLNKASKPATRAVRERTKNRRVRKQREGDAQKKRDIAKKRVKDSKDGGEYVLPRLGRKIEGRRNRIEAAKKSSRTRTRGQLLARSELKPVEKALRKITARSATLSQKQVRQGARDAIATVAVYGLPRSYEAAVRAMKRAESQIAKPDPEKGEIEPSVTDRSNFKFLRENPELFKDKAFWEAVDAYKGSAEKILTSEPKRWLAIGATYGVRSVGARLSRGQMIGGRLIKTKDYDPDTIARMEEALRVARGEQRRKEAELKNTTLEGKELYEAQRSAARSKAQADKLRDELRDWNKAIRKAKDDFVKETREVAAREGLETPAYVKSAEDRSFGLGAEPQFMGNRLASKMYKDMDVARQRGTSDRSFETLVRGSVVQPRMVRLIHNQVTRFVANKAVPVATKRGNKRYLTSGEIRAAVARGDLSPKDYVVFHSQHFRRAIEDIRPDERSGNTLYGTIDDLGDFPSLVKEVERGSSLKGHKYVVMPKWAAKELAEQFDGKDTMLTKINRAGSRIILGYNPAWALAQLAAEGLPAAVAVGNPVRLARAIKANKAMKSMSPEEQAAWDSLAGTTAGSLSLPKVGVDARARDIDVGAPLTMPGRVKSLLWRATKGEALGDFDRWKGGGIRKIVLAAKVDKEFNQFMKGLGGTLKIDDAIRRKMKGKTRAEQQAIIAKNPKLARQFEDYLDDVMGNWRAITSLERTPASLIAFYPFVRYALRSGFWGFPAQHPIKSSMLYFFAQQNAEQLEKLVPGGPARWLDYAFPVITADGKGKPLPAGTRIAPALSVLADAIGSNDLSRFLLGLNPLVGSALTGVSGNDPFSREKVAANIPEQALLGLAALASMVAPIRVLDDVGAPVGIESFKPRQSWDEEDGTAVGGRSTSGEKFDALDPVKGVRSVLFPYLPQAGEDYAKQVKLQKAIERGDWSPVTGDDSKKDDPWYQALSAK